MTKLDPAAGISRFGIALAVSVMATALATGAHAADVVKTYVYTFDYPMAWSDDIVLKGLAGNQGWEVVPGGKQGNSLLISAAKWKQPRSGEIRTLQFNHKPGTKARIRFDIKAVCAPPKSRFMVRYFDGYCGGEPFGTIADDEIAQFPPPLLDTARTRLQPGWQHLSLETDVLKHTVLTIAFVVDQEPETTSSGEPLYMEYMLDNLEIETTMLDKYMDPGFDWHGVPGSSTRHFRQNVACAGADWCDFADQEDVTTPDGKVIHYTLFQFRDSSSHVKPEWKHKLLHADYADYGGGVSAIVLDRWGGGKNSSASWGVRQTVSYEALGLTPEETAKIQIVGKIANFNPDDSDATSVQLGVDPYGGVITQKAKWLPPDRSSYKIDGWRKPVLEFERPADSDGFTVFFRHLDGLPKPEVERLPFPEPQTAGSPGLSAGMADWIVVKVVK